MGESIITVPAELILLGCAVVVVIFLGIVISLSVKLKRLQKNYQRMMNGMGVANLEEILLQMQSQWNEQAAASSQVESELQSIQRRLQQMKSNVGVYRYNAFAETGSDLSFSVAILDDLGSGVVLSGIHSRDEMYLYAKPIDKGSSPYALTPEEREAITRTSQRG